MATVQGFVEKIKYRNEDNGYTVLSLAASDDEYILVGTFPYINEGEMIEASGTMREHPIYGEQLQVESYEIKTPEDADSMERYLASGAIKGVGAALAARIVRRFKADTFRIMEEEPERLAEIKGISERKAREIGCKNVCFVTPNGLDVADADGNEHSASAADMARIMRYCAFQSPCRETFLEITRTASRTIQDESGNRSFYLANHNALLSQCAEVLSGKTGFTGKAGYCYVAALKKEGKAFTVALLGCGWPPHKTYKWADMRKLDQYAFDTYNWYDIFDREKTFPEVEVRRGVKGTTALTLNLPSEKQMFLMLLRADEKPDIRYEYPTELEAPVHEGQEVGQASYYINDEQVAAYPIYAAETVEKIDYGCV